LDAPVSFPPDFVEQRHGTDDFLYKARAALAKVAVEDDFGAKLLRRKGRTANDIDLEF
jgi:hypothetical protein